MKVRIKIVGGRSWLIAFLLCVVASTLLLFMVRPVRADTVPQNGDFSGGLVDSWACTVYSDQCGYDGGVGHTANGSLIVKNGGSIAWSLPFMPSSDSTLDFWIKPQGTGTWHYHIADWSASVYQDFTCDVTNGTWNECNTSLAGFDGHRVSIAIQSGAGTYSWYDDFVVTDALLLDANSYQYVNGNFYATWSQWVSVCGDVYDGDVGHTDVGSLANGNDCIYSAPFVPEGSWNMWCKRATGDTDRYCEMYAIDFFNDVSEYSVGGVGSLTDSWVNQEVSLLTVSDHPIIVHLHTNGAYLDDFCNDDFGCSLGTPTPTVAPTETSTAMDTSTSVVTPTDCVGCTSTPIVFPTQIPPLTQIPYPTPLYGVGTPQPISGGGSTGLCPNSDPCIVLNPAGTPIFITTNGTPQLITTDGTPLPIEGGNKTPVVVVVATPTLVAVDYNSLTDGGGVVTTGSPESFADTADINPVIPIDTSGSADVSQVADLGLTRQSFSVCLPAVLAQVLTNTPCWDGSLILISRFTFLGVDFLPIFTLMLAVMLVIVIWAGIRSR